MSTDRDREALLRQCGQQRRERETPEEKETEEDDSK